MERHAGQPGQAEGCDNRLQILGRCNCSRRRVAAQVAPGPQPSAREELKGEFPNSELGGSWSSQLT